MKAELTAGGEISLDEVATEGLDFAAEGTIGVLLEIDG